AGARRAARRFGTGLCSGPGAFLARDAGGHPNLRRLARIGLRQRNLEIVSEVGAALASGPLPAAPPAHELPEEVVEDVGHGGGEVGAEATGPAPAAIEGGMAELVVGCPLLRIFQRLVGLGDLLETLLGRLVARVVVRMALLGEPPE